MAPSRRADASLLAKDRPRAGVDSTHAVLDHAGAQLLDLRMRRGPEAEDRSLHAPGNLKPAATSKCAFALLLQT